jgi:hypothetical protein
VGFSVGSAAGAESVGSAAVVGVGALAVALVTRNTPPAHIKASTMMPARDSANTRPQPD